MLPVSMPSNGMDGDSCHVQRYESSLAFGNLDRSTIIVVDDLNGNGRAAFDKSNGNTRASNDLDGNVIQCV
jgi:hypothetical protein